MCIRDRIYMMAPPNTRHQVIVGELYATIRNYITVSYTHLDVYKRQRLRLGSIHTASVLRVSLHYPDQKLS